MLFAITIRRLLFKLHCVCREDGMTDPVLYYYTFASLCDGSYLCCFLLVTYVYVVYI